MHCILFLLFASGAAADLIHLALDLLTPVEVVVDLVDFLGVDVGGFLELALVAAEVIINLLRNLLLILNPLIDLLDTVIKTVVVVDHGCVILCLVLHRKAMLGAVPLILGEELDDDEHDDAHEGRLHVAEEEHSLCHLEEFDGATLAEDELFDWHVDVDQDGVAPPRDYYKRDSTNNQAIL